MALAQHCKGSWGFFNALRFFDLPIDNNGRKKVPEALLHARMVMLSLLNLCPGTGVSVFAASDFFSNILKLSPVASVLLSLIHI